MDFEDVAFDELLAAVVDNRGRSCPTSPAGIPLIATNCIRNELLYPARENIRYVSQATYDTWFRGHPAPGDILFVNKGTPGRVCLVPDPVDFVIAQDMVAVRADHRRVYPKYLFAALRSAEVQEQIEQMHVGTMIPHFKKADFHRLTIPVPVDRQLQEFIGDAYFALSAKIDSHLRASRTLDDISHALFQSWFVDFDGVVAKAEGRRAVGICDAAHDAMPCGFVEIDGEETPDGWRRCRLGDVVAINARQVTREYPYPEIEYVDISSVDRGRLLDLRHVLLSEAPSRARRLVQHGDVIWSCVRPNHRAYLRIDSPPKNMVVSTGFAVLTPREISSAFLYLHATTEDFIDYLVANAEGSAYPAVRPEAFGRAMVTLPSPAVIQAFEDLVGPILARVAAYERENRTIVELRDTLLAQLLSGAVRPREAERAVAAVT